MLCVTFGGMVSERDRVAHPRFFFCFNMVLTSVDAQLNSAAFRLYHGKEEHKSSSFGMCNFAANCVSAWRFITRLH